MAKRLTDTEKYKDSWFLDLKPNEKLLFYFLIDNVDSGGFWEESIRTITFFLGLTENEYLGARQGLGRGLIISDCGKILYLKNFLKHQKMLPLNKYNNYHKSSLEKLKKGIENFTQNIEFFNDLPCSHIRKQKGKVIEKTNENLKAYLAPSKPLSRGTEKVLVLEKDIVLKEEDKCIILSACEKILKIYPRIGLYNKAQSAVYNAIITEAERLESLKAAAKFLETVAQDYADKVKSGEIPRPYNAENFFSNAGWLGKEPPSETSKEKSTGSDIQAVENYTGITEGFK